MEKKEYYRLPLILFLFLISIACSISFDQEVDADYALEVTRFALQLTQDALERNASQSDSATANQQPNPSGDNGSQTKPGSETDPSEEEQIPCNDSRIIRETIKDGAVFQPGEKFEKSWTLRNEGSCNWDSNYALKFIEGTRMSGESFVQVSSVIEPNEEITFIVHLTAPDQPGDYTGVWRLFSGAGEELGKYWATITVAQPQEPFSVKSVTTNLVDVNPAACPHSIDVDISITTNGSGAVTFRPETSDLGLHPADEVVFNAAGTKTESYDWTIQASGDYWMKVHIDQPNNQVFGPYHFTLTCP